MAARGSRGSHWAACRTRCSAAPISRCCCAGGGRSRPAEVRRAAMTPRGSRPWWSRPLRLRAEARGAGRACRQRGRDAAARITAPMMRATILAVLLAWGGAGAGTSASTPTATPARTQDPTCAGVLAPWARADTVPALALVLNVPAARLDAFEYGRLTRSWDVAVGERRYPTPLGSFWISEVT